MNRTQVRSRSRRAALVGVAAAIGALCAGGSAAAATLPTGYQSSVFATGATTTDPTGATVSAPDDITRLRKVIYVAYQNGTAADGSTGGDSTVVGYLPNGKQAGSWNLPGHVDGLTADHDLLIATVNEDANSSLFTIRPAARKSRQVRAYSYSPALALPAGGTDAISIVDGKILISGSNPTSTTTPPSAPAYSSPAVYAAKIPPRGSVVKLTPVFNDNSRATDAVSGQTADMNLSDPDSNAAVPQQSPRFRGQFMLDSQGDSELIFDRHPGRPSQSLTVLNLTSSAGPPQVDDVRWSTSPKSTLYVVDAGANTVYAITGPFGTGTVIAAIPSGGPPPALPLAGDLGTVDLSTGAVTPFATGFDSPKGLLFVSVPNGHHGRHQGRGDKSHGHHHG